MEKIDLLIDLLKNSKYTVVLTGAGISTAAGIHDFRGEKGIYTLKKYDPYRAFNYSYFVKDPSYFFDFAKEFVELHREIKPTKMHRVLAYLEEEGYIKSVITQNIDGLHQKAKSKKVIELHGTITTGNCLNCNKGYDFNQMAEMLKKEGKIICSQCGGIVKPNIVFFGEPVKYLFEAEYEVKRADLFIVIGSSLAVNPCAFLPFISKGKKVIINMGKVEIPKTKFDLFIEEDIEKVANAILKSNIIKRKFYE